MNLLKLTLVWTRTMTWRGIFTQPLATRRMPLLHRVLLTLRTSFHHYYGEHNQAYQEYLGVYG